MTDSALDLVRKLKGPADPPTPGGLNKIELAQQGWSNPYLYMPNKAETILEWLLKRLLKDKDKDPTANPMLNFKYWSLLNEVVTSVIPALTNPLNNPARLWLVPLVNRVPLVPILTKLLTLFSVDEHVSEEPLLSLALRSFYALWPYAAPKITLDSLLDCSGALFGYLSASSCKVLFEQTDLKSDLTEFALTVYASYKESLGNAAHKKKICVTFIQQHLRHWLTCVSSRKGTLESDESLSATFEIGVETIFNVDVLRVAHEQRAHTSLDDTLGILIAQAPEFVLGSLPNLFKSYIEVNKKFRNALFGQGSKNTGVTAAEQARGASMKFFATCDSLLRSIAEDEAVWQARLALLTIVNEEDLVVTGEQESVDILQPIGDLAVTSLAAASQVHDSGVTRVILDVLSVIVHIDYDLVPGALTHVLPVISMSLDVLPTALSYLGKALNFHTKTRTVDAFTNACLTFLINQSTVTQNPRLVYETASSSAMFNHVFLDQLSKAIHGFLTPGQVPELAQSVISYLQSRIEDFEESISRSTQNDDSSRKKRKRDKQTAPFDADQAAVVFALTSKIAAITLTSLPFQIILDDVQASVKTELQEFYDGVTRRILKIAPKACLDDTNNTWSWQLVTSSILRLGYYLLDGQLVTDDASLSPALFEMLKISEILPELRIEIYRTLLYEASLDKFSASDIVEEIFQEVQQASTANSATWTGELHRLGTDGQNSTIPVAGLQLLLDRWLPMLDSLGTSEQLRFVAELMLSIISRGSTPAPSPVDVGGLTVHSIFAKVLRNAEFWELPNFRNAFVSLLDERTESLDAPDIHQCLSHHALHKPSKPPTQEELSIQAVYYILLYAPVEYLPRDIRTDLLRRAMIADVSIGRSVWEHPLHSDQLRRLVSLRLFISRVFAHTGTVEHNAMGRYTNYLMKPSYLSVDDSTPFNHVTLGLIELHLRSLLSSAEKGDETDLVELINIFRVGYEYLDKGKMNGLPERSLVSFIDMVLSKYRPSELKKTVVDALGSMQMTLSPVFYERLDNLVKPQRIDRHFHELMEMEDTLNAWHRLLSLRGWLSRKGFSKMFFGQKLARQYLDEEPLSTSDSPGVPSAILSICLAELQFINERAEQLQFVVAIYLAFRLKCGDTRHNRLDDGFAAACKKLSIQDFSDVLNLIIDGLAKQGLEKTSLCDLIHLSGILVHDAPEGTLKTTQEHVSRALSIFVNCPLYTAETGLVQRAIEFVAKYFNSRPAAIKSSHVSLTWALLGSCLAGATSHDTQTNRRLFQDAISILSALIRLRRDLVLPSLPLLCVMLSRLIICLKSVFPNLGARQSKLVSNTLPRWINPHEPLGTEESRTLGRLLTTLTTKTIIRTHNTSAADTQKADSLVRPLSKHVSVVLKTYVDTLTDPLCILPSETRRELEPGLYALCEIIGEQYRDAMMVTLDAAGKAVMKGLWREYEKQRYVGRG